MSDTPTPDPCLPSRMYLSYCATHGRPLHECRTQVEEPAKDASPEIPEEPIER